MRIVCPVPEAQRGAARHEPQGDTAGKVSVNRATHVMDIVS